MQESCVVPSPVNFNCWKHHTGFIKQQIENFSQSGNLTLLKRNLLKIGESQMDMYLGEHTPSEIGKQIISYLKREKSFLFDKYTDWLKTDDRKHKLVRLSDKSIWTLRLSESSERYVHIHPGRHFPHTIRVKATTLKTAILILCFEQVGEVENINIESANQIRKKYLNEPSLKSLSKASGLIRLINLFNSK